MNKVTRICVFVLLIAVTLYVGFGYMGQSVKVLKYYSEASRENSAIMYDYTAEILHETMEIAVYALICIANILILIFNFKWFFKITDKAEFRRAKKIEKMQEKLNNLKGDE